GGGGGGGGGKEYKKKKKKKKKIILQHHFPSTSFLLKHLLFPCNLLLVFCPPSLQPLRRLCERNVSLNQIKSKDGGSGGGSNTKIQRTSFQITKMSCWVEEVRGGRALAG
ncbi:hypothetical protein D9O29_23560, partial [Pantoea vagans]